jgi:methionyl-tRNA formyltransferase
MAGDRETGVTIMRVVKALDAGPMLATVTRPIGSDETSVEVERDLAELGAELLVSTIDRLARGPIEEVAQDDTAATYAPRLTKEEGLVDWSRPATEIHNRIRGLHPWPHAYTFFGDRRLILRRSTALDGATPALPGVVVSAHGDELRVSAGSGLVEIKELQAEGKRPMTVRQFLVGHDLAAGAVLSSSP